MIETASLLPIADVLKPFGANGTLIIKFRPQAEASFKEGYFKETEPVFAIMDGLPVPFFFSAFQLHGQDRAKVCFESLEREARARELVGKTLYQSIKRKSGKGRTKAKHPQQEDILDPNLLVGFTVSDQLKGPLGTVAQFMDWAMNPCLSIRQEGKAEELLVPFNAIFVIDLDFNARHITLSLPNGLLELY